MNISYTLVALLFTCVFCRGICSSFETAQNQLDKGNIFQAISHFAKNIEETTDRSESSFSKYMLGVCHEKLEDWSQALYWYLEAFQTDATKLDPLYKIASHYRKNEKYDLAYLFAKCGSLLAHLDDNFEDYKLDEELSIVSYYTPYKEDGLRAASGLLIKKNVPRHVKDLASKNILFYVKNLPKTRFLNVDVELPLIDEKKDERYHPMNPSIVKTRDGFLVICRTVNYQQIGAKHFTTSDIDGIIRTKNFLMKYDKDFKVLSQVEIEDSQLKKEGYRSSLVQGQEDCRIFLFQDAPWFTCTLWGYPPQMALGKLDDKGVIESLTPLIGPDPNRCEKNWLPFVKDGIIHTIYSSDPFIVHKLNVETGSCDLALQYSPEFDFTGFRGSAGPIAFDQGYLMLIHEVSFLPDFSRVYLHRFVYLDADFHIKKVSKPFTFKHQGVEFCTSMTLNHVQDELVMTIGIEDKEAYFMFIATKDVIDTLRDHD